MGARQVADCDGCKRTDIGDGAGVRVYQPSTPDYDGDDSGEVEFHLCGECAIRLIQRHVKARKVFVAEFLAGYLDPIKRAGGG